MKPQLLPVLFLHNLSIPLKNPNSNAQDILPSILVVSANSLLHPFPPASQVRSGCVNDLRMEDTCEQLNIAVLHGPNMCFWILHLCT